jgi:acetyl-CoA carboxylase biotin carboxyl carrier protein
MVDWELVKKLIKVVKEEGITGLAIEEGGVKYEVRRQGNEIIASPAPLHHAPAAHPAAASAKPAHDEDDGLTPIISPMVGTFYRSPSPEMPPFVEAGQEIEPGKTVCIIEAMKLFNEIEAEIRGKVVKILVENGQPVEYGQKLMLIKKS